MTIPLEGTLKRCAHGVYDPDSTGRYCQFCNRKHCRPATLQEEKRAACFSMPSIAIRVNINDKANREHRSNKNESSTGAMPRCGSTVHYTKKEMARASFGSARNAETNSSQWDIAPPLRRWSVSGE